MNALEIEAGDGGIQRVLVLVLQRIVVGDGTAAFDGAGLADGAGPGQQGFDQGGLAAAGVSDDGDVADVLGSVFGHSEVLYFPCSALGGRTS